MRLLRVQRRYRPFEHARWHCQFCDVTAGDLAADTALSTARGCLRSLTILLEGDAVLQGLLGALRDNRHVTSK